MNVKAAFLTFALDLIILAVPLAAEAQLTGKPPRIGYLGEGTASGSSPTLEGFRQGLREHDWLEGQNVAIEYRWAEGRRDRYPISRLSWSV